MVNLIVSLFEGLIISLPSKRNGTINKNFKLLRQEKWFKELLTKYGPFMQLKDSVRNLVEQKGGVDMKILSLTGAILLVAVLFGCEQNNSNNSTDNNSNSQNTNSNDSSTNNNSIEQKKESTPQSLEIEDYYPISENTRYVYEGTGNEYASYDVYIDYTSKDRVQQRIDNGGTVMANVLELKNGKISKVYSRGEAYYRENLLKSKGNEEEILLMEPIVKGTTWTLKDSRVRTITNTSVDITTPAGSFKAIEVTTKSPYDQTIDYYAKNVGLVKSVFISGENEISSSLSKMEKNVPFIQLVNFYYPNIDDEKIYYKSKEVHFHTNDITKKVLETSYKESINNHLGKVLSTNTKINSLYLNKDMNVYLDVNQAFLTEMNAGALFEAMILQSIANTFGQYYNAQNVYLTIDNKPYESGHIYMKKGEYLKVKVEDEIEIK